MFDERGQGKDRRQKERRKIAPLGKKPQRYVILMDEDANDFLCPANKIKKAEEYFEALDEWIRCGGEDSDPQFTSSEPLKRPTCPSWLKKIDNLWKGLSFTDPRIENAKD